MPTFISDQGIWRAAPERAVNIKTNEIYEGPDREATKIIEQETGSKEGTLGVDPRELPENIELAHQRNVSMDKLLKLDTPMTPEALRNEEAKKKMVVTHSQPSRKRGIDTGTRGAFGDHDKYQA